MNPLILYYKMVFLGLDLDYLPSDPELKKEVMEEAHSSNYYVHLGSTKMYRDLRTNFWWTNIK